jgi:DNA-binding transcriptional ArsR family regulator
VSRSPLERLLNHDLRLDLLCCLLDGPLPLAGLSARLGKPVASGGYHLKTLDDHGVVEAIECVEGDDVLYAATLDGHPPWVAEAVADHNDPDADRPDNLSTLRAVVGMKCDGCERLLRYKGEVVAVYDEDGQRRARLVSEDTPGSGEAAGLRATAKYHRDCYDEVRGRDPALPPIHG